jgi:hypothetical protein
MPSVTLHTAFSLAFFIFKMSLQFHNTRVNVISFAALFSSFPNLQENRKSQIALYADFLIEFNINC